MSDVARAAGVSIATVSCVLNGTRRVRPETAAAVWAAIESSGYVRDTLARSLVTRRTMTIGVALAEVEAARHPEIVRVVERVLAAAGYGLALLYLRRGDEAVRDIEPLLSRRVDGLILMPSTDPTGLLEAASRMAVPVVLLGVRVDNAVDQVAYEHVESTRRLVEHLIDHGHDRIGLVLGPTPSMTEVERLEGYRSGLHSRYLPFSSARVIHTDATAFGGEAATEVLMGEMSPSSAVILGSTLEAMGALRALRRAGWRVPADMAVAAFGEPDWAEFTHPALASVAGSSEEMGRRAVSLLLERLADPSGDASKVVLAERFVARTSCGCTRSLGVEVRSGPQRSAMRG